MRVIGAVLHQKWLQCTLESRLPKGEVIDVYQSSNLSCNKKKNPTYTRFQSEFIFTPVYSINMTLY